VFQVDGLLVLKVDIANPTLAGRMGRGAFDGRWHRYLPLRLRTGGICREGGGASSAQQKSGPKRPLFRWKTAESFDGCKLLALFAARLVGGFRAALLTPVRGRERLGVAALIARVHSENLVSAPCAVFSGFAYSLEALPLPQPFRVVHDAPKFHGGPFLIGLRNDPFADAAIDLV